MIDVTEIELLALKVSTGALLGLLHNAAESS